MNFWKEHLALRLVLMLVFFVVGILLLIGGWKMTGKLPGLALMLVGTTLLLTVLLLYNKPFETPARHSGNKR